MNFRIHLKNKYNRQYPKHKRSLHVRSNVCILVSNLFLYNKFIVKTQSARPTSYIDEESDVKYIKYQSSAQTKQYANMPTTRIFRMSSMSVDPLEPPKFKYRNMHRGISCYFFPFLYLFYCHRPTTTICTCDALTA